MKTLLSIMSLAFLATTLVAATPTRAEEGGPDVEGVTGEIHINLNSDYPKVEINGDSEWGAIEFEKKGKRVLIKNLPLDRGAITVTLSPIYDTLLPQTLTFELKSFKKTRKGRMYLMVAKEKVSFKKNPNAAPTPAAPTPAPDKPAAPTPDDDDL